MTFKEYVKICGENGRLKVAAKMTTYYANKSNKLAKASLELIKSQDFKQMKKGIKLLKKSLIALRDSNFFYEEMVKSMAKVGMDDFTLYRAKMQGFENKEKMKQIADKIITMAN